MEEGKLMEYFLGLLGQIKVFHWATQEYSKHKALDELHSKMQSLVDKFIEVFIGRYKKQPLKNFKIEMTAHSDLSKLDKFLEVERENIRKLHTTSFKNATELQNILDEMLLCINQSIYLCNLK
jgi:hypothetical protein